MEKDMQGQKRVGLAFTERFDDLFSTKIYATVALGLFLAWAWMGLTEGYPIFMDGSVDTWSTVIMLLSFALSLLAPGFIRRLGTLFARPAYWISAAACTAAVCVLLLCIFHGILPLEDMRGGWSLSP